MITDCALYLNRHTALRLGCRKEIPCLTVSKLCGSGFQAIVNSIQDLAVGDSNIVLTGGSDNMSDSPFALKGFRFGMKLSQVPETYDMLWASLSDSYVKMPMGLTAEKLGAQYNLSRLEVDEYSLLSQLRWKKAYDAGVFKDEIAPVQVKTRKGMVTFDTDEHPKPETTMEGLAKLPTIFKKDGLVTAGSSSGICDGAGALILCNEHALDKYDLKPLAKIVGYGMGGCKPETMGYAPVPAINNLLDKTGYSLDEIDQLEINEAFGAQVPRRNHHKGRYILYPFFLSGAGLPEGARLSPGEVQLLRRRHRRGSPHRRHRGQDQRPRRPQAQAEQREDRGGLRLHRRGTGLEKLIYHLILKNNYFIMLPFSPQGIAIMYERM